MKTNHIPLRRNIDNPTPDEAYRGMASACWAFEILLKDKRLIDPTYCTNWEELSAEEIRDVIEPAFQLMRDAAIEFGLDVTWPLVASGPFVEEAK